MFGDGKDGELIVASGQTVYLDDLVPFTGASGAIAVGQNILPVESTVGFSVGDLILVHQSRGSIAVGNWEFAYIDSISTGNLILKDGVQINYYEDGGNGQVQVQKVPQFTNCTIEATGKLTVRPWNGNTKGILTFLCKNTLSVDGTITASGVGYRAHVMANNNDRAGNPTGSCTGSPTFQGEGTNGPLGIYRDPNGTGGGGGLAAGVQFRVFCRLLGLLRAGSILPPRLSSLTCPPPCPPPDLPPG